MPNDPWTAETGREAGLASAAARAATKGKTAEERALLAISRKLGQLTNELLRAALGEGPFEDLKPEVRVGALKTLMEYGLGKPTAGSKTVEGATEPSGPSPEDLFAKPHVNVPKVQSATDVDTPPEG